MPGANNEYWRQEEFDTVGINHVRDEMCIRDRPLSMGLNCGETVLTVAVLSIIITAPLGALLIDLTYKKLLTKNTLQKQIK